MRLATLLLSAGLTVLLTINGFAEADRPHNLILFIPDGLRALKVSPETAPTMAAIRDKGVNFTNPHSLFPTFPWPTARRWPPATISATAARSAIPFSPATVSRRLVAP
jgi:hypothetical protein